jgi:hypothetical protein
MLSLFLKMMLNNEYYYSGYCPLSWFLCMKHNVPSSDWDQLFLGDPIQQETLCAITQTHPVLATFFFNPCTIVNIQNEPCSQNSPLTVNKMSQNKTYYNMYEYCSNIIFNEQSSYIMLLSLNLSVKSYIMDYIGPKFNWDNVTRSWSVYVSEDACCGHLTYDNV